MPVPDPEDSKYWYRSVDAKGPCLKFDLYKYIKDFRRWKERTKQRFSICEGCTWKDVCAKMRAEHEGICPDLLAPYEVYVELFGCKEARMNDDEQTAKNVVESEPE